MGKISQFCVETLRTKKPHAILWEITWTQILECDSFQYERELPRIDQIYMRVQIPLT